MGITQPRLYTPPLRQLNRRTSKGYEVCDLAEMVGEPLLPWQRWAAIHALETMPDGSYRFRVVLILVARQNGKSHLKRMVSLWRLYLDGARLILGVAQDVSLAREQWQFALDVINRCPDLAAELDRKSARNGDEWFRVASGGRYKISAANRSAGRGLSVDELTIDELREQRSWDAWSALSKTTLARANSQIWCMSNAGDDESVVLNQLREAALSGRDPSIGIFEWSAPDNCELDDIQGWRQANPAMGIMVSEAGLRTALATDPPGVFRTEVLCQRVDHLDSAIDLAAWRACADAAGTMDRHRRHLAACLDVAPDGKHATLVAAARMEDGRVRLEAVAAWDSTDAARTELEALLKRVRPAAFAWYPAGPAAALAPLLQGLARTYNRGAGKRAPDQLPEDGRLTGGRVGEVCQGLADLVTARRVVHPGDPLLDAHIGAAQKLHSGDGWRFTRNGEGHVDAAYAAAGAVYTALTMPGAKRARIRMLA